MYVIEERAAGRPHLVTDVGVRLPAHLTASGRAILAALPESQVRALYPSADAFVDRHGTGPSSLSQLGRVLVDVRRSGVAVVAVTFTDESDVDRDVLALAVQDTADRLAGGCTPAKEIGVE